MTATGQKCSDCSEVPRCPSAGFEMTCSTGGWKRITPATAEMSEAEAAGPAPLLPDDSDWPPATVRCDQDKHDVMPGEFCPHCGENPKCAGCPANELEG